jgi:hypothetical protein
MARFVHVGFGFGGLPKILDLEPIFSEMGDWIRYSSTGWMLWTDLSLPEINLRLIQSVDVEDSYMISGVDQNQISAYVPTWVWEWIRSKMPSSSFTVGETPVPSRSAPYQIGKK